jgi:hypothetical protein
MQIEHERFRISVEVPDEEVALPEPAADSRKSTECFSEESRNMLSRLCEIREAIRAEPAKGDSEMSEEEGERWRAFAFRAKLREEEGGAGT